MGIPSWLGRAIAISAIGLALAFAYLTSFKPFPDLSQRLSRLELSSVVLVKMSSGYGSGFHIGAGHYLTARHVMGNAKAATLQTEGKISTRAEIVLLNEEYDFAVVRSVNDLPVKTLKLDCRAPIIGEEIHAIGNPTGYPFTTTFGHISGKNLKGDWASVATPVNMTVMEGMSGGPVLSKSGLVIGLVHSTYDQRNFGLVIPTEVICPILKEAGVI